MEAQRDDLRQRRDNLIEDAEKLMTQARQAQGTGIVFFRGSESKNYEDYSIVKDKTKQIIQAAKRKLARREKGVVSDLESKFNEADIMHRAVVRLTKRGQPYSEEDVLAEIKKVKEEA